MSNNTFIRKDTVCDTYSFINREVELLRDIKDTINNLSKIFHDIIHTLILTIKINSTFSEIGNINDVLFKTILVCYEK